MLNKENAIEVRNVKKSFKVYYDKGTQLKEKVLFRARNRYENREVLKGISFDVKKGEAIGLIGHNGCGKSTTLKLLTRIIYPDSGTIEMGGRVSSLIELGAGFHPDMSGRENIYTNASIFGLGKKEIDQRMDDIIAFSELEEFIDNPVRTYSSGMYMRLAFAVAINVDADILLIDEILAVGDVAFQAKCFNKLREIKAKGTTIVIVSHSLSQIEQICDRSIWIHEGLIKQEGEPRIVDPMYLSFMSEKADERKKKEADAVKDKSVASDEKEEKEGNGQGEDNSKRWGSGEAKITTVTMLDKGGNVSAIFHSHDTLLLEIGYETKTTITDAVIGIAVYRNDGTYVYGTNTLIDTAKPTQLGERGSVQLVITDLALTESTYSIDLAIHKPDGFNYDFWREVCSFDVLNAVSEAGVVSITHEWKVD